MPGNKSRTQKSSFVNRVFEKFDNYAICMEKCILKLEFGNEFQNFEENYSSSVKKDLSKHEKLSKPRKV